MSVPDSYLNKDLNVYLDDLSARKITPGGGSASALTASIAAGLNLMVINFTLDKEGNGSDKLLEAREGQLTSFNKLKGLIHEDCSVFKRLMKALASKEPDVEERYKEAAMVPAEICRQCHSSIDISSYLVKDGNRNLISDVGSASSILKAAFSAARHNVHINLNEMKDKHYAEKVLKEIDSMHHDVTHIDKALQISIKDIMNGEDF